MMAFCGSFGSSSPSKWPVTRVYAPAACVCSITSFATRASETPAIRRRARKEQEILRIKSSARRRNAGETRRIVDIAISLSARYLWIGAERSGAIDFARSPMGRHNAIRGSVLCDPCIERGKRIENGWARSALAVTHAGNHEQTCEIAATATNRALHRVEILDRVFRRHHRISPALIEDQLSLVRAKWTQVRVESGSLRKLFIRPLHVTVEIESRGRPLQIAEEPEPPEIHTRRFCMTDKIAAPPGFGTGNPAGKDPLVGAWIDRPVI